MDLTDTVEIHGAPATLRRSYLASVVVGALLFLVCGCGARDAVGAAEPRAAQIPPAANRWCQSAEQRNPLQFEGMTLSAGVTSTLGELDTWRARQGAADGYRESLEGRFPSLAGLTATDPLGVCLFVGPARPIPHPQGLDVVADGTRMFVTPAGDAVVDAIGPQASLRTEMLSIHA